MKKLFTSFRNRMAFVFGLVTIVIGILLIAYINTIASQKMTEASTESLESIAKAMANAMSDTLVEREREVLLLSKSPLLQNRSFESHEIRSVVNAMESSYPNYSWIGITDAQGVVKVASQGMLEGVNVSSKSWFEYGKKASYIGDVHEAVLLAKMLQAPNADEPLRFIDFASPIRDSQGVVMGVVATHANWIWAKKVFESSLPHDAEEKGIEAYVLSSGGKILYPYSSIDTVKVPKNLVQGNKRTIFEWEEGEEFLSAYANVKAKVSTDLGWSIVVRQPVDKALESVNALHRNLILIGIALSLLHVWLAYYFATQLSQPIETLAKASQEMSDGNKNADFTTTSSLNEVRTLSFSIKTMIAKLLQHENELEVLNATLEHKVKERTLELENANEKLTYLSRHDALTQLHNRLATNEYLYQEFARMKRTQQLFSVALMDIDYFKKVNDTYGHDVGDSVLKYVAKVLKKSARETDFVARFGGEEFLIVFPDTLKEGAIVISEKIRQAIENSTPPEVNKITLSIGVATASLDEENDDCVIKKADNALYQAKNAGRNKVVFQE